MHALVAGLGPRGEKQLGRRLAHRILHLGKHHVDGRLGGRRRHRQRVVEVGVGRLRACKCSNALDLLFELTEFLKLILELAEFRELAEFLEFELAKLGVHLGGPFRRLPRHAP